MNEKEKIIAPLLVTSMMLGELANNSSHSREPKERTIRKCADPKKKAKRKMVQASRRKNRR